MNMRVGKHDAFHLEFGSKHLFVHDELHMYVHTLKQAETHERSEITRYNCAFD